MESANQSTALKPIVFTMLMFGYNDVLTYLTNLFLARYLGTEHFGDYSVAYAAIMIIGNIALFGLGNVSLKVIPQYKVQKNEALIPIFFKFAIAVALAASIIFGVVGTALYHLVNQFIVGKEHLPLSIAFFTLPVITINLLMYNILVSLDMPLRSILMQTMLRPTLFILLIVLITPLFFSYRAEHVLLLYALTIIVVDGYYLIQVRKKANLHLDKKIPPRSDITSWFQLGLPFMVQAILFSAVQFMPVLFLETFQINEAHVGIYSVCSQIACFSLVFVRAINLLAKPQLSYLLNENDKADLNVLLRRNLRFLLVLCFILLMAAVCFGKPLLGLYGEVFLMGYTPFLILVIGMIFSMYCSLSVSLIAMSNYENALLKIFPLMFLGMLFLNAILIPLWGMLGAALSVTIPSIITHCFTVYYAQRKIGIAYRPW